ncbi:MAG: endonuclease III [Rickettsiales bacterium]|nr:MAG: endonuclease III [Rickettsiales bacterium]
MPTVKQINEIFKIFSAKNPTPRTELNFIDNFTLTVAVILSAQATDISVNKATKELFKTYQTPKAIFDLGVVELKKYIKSIGLYNTKAKNIIALCRILIDKYNSRIPDSFEDLIKLPGIGRKTANVILNCAFGKPTMAVDTHVFRVAHRIGLSNGKTPEKVEYDLLHVIPDVWLLCAHHWLILHGRYICKARIPLCKECSIAEYCDYYNNINKIG